MRGFNIMKLLIGILSMMFVISVTPALADVPEIVSYQCNLEKAGGMDGVTQVSMTFDFYAEMENGTSLDTVTIDNNAVVNNIVSVEIPIDSAILDDAKYMGVSINGGDQMTPRTKLTSALFALRARSAMTLVNPQTNSINGNVLEDGSVTSTQIGDGTIVENDIADGAVSSNKIITSAPDVGLNETEEISLNNADQGLVLVSGEKIINLPAPVNGLKFTIKKIDNGLRTANESDLYIDTNVQTIQCAGDTCIENRTNQIKLKHKNAYVTLVAVDGVWYATESNPPLDIISPVPGNLGEVVVTTNNGKLTSNSPVTIEFSEASDCGISECDPKAPLEYMVYYSENAQKINSLEAISEEGIECLPEGWIEYTPSVECDPTAYSYFAEYRVNVVVRDEAGNKAIYCGPGDNVAPTILGDKSEKLTISIDQSGYIDIKFNRAEDGPTGSTDDELRYYLYYSIGNDNYEDIASLSTLDEIPPSVHDAVTGVTHPLCNGQGITDPHIACGKATDAEAGPFMAGDSDTEGEMVRVRMPDLQNSTIYNMTVIVKDLGGNKFQYQTISFETQATWH